MFYPVETVFTSLLELSANSDPWTGYCACMCLYVIMLMSKIMHWLTHENPCSKEQKINFSHSLSCIMGQKCHFHVQFAVTEKNENSQDIYAFKSDYVY